MALTEQNKVGMLAEVFDPNRVTIWCSRHNYIGPVKEQPGIKPHLGCTDCWRVFYIHELADCPPDKRREKLEEIEEVMHKVLELVENGKWDLEMYPHAKIEIGEEN